MNRSIFSCGQMLEYLQKKKTRGAGKKCAKVRRGSKYISRNKHLWRAKHTCALPSIDTLRRSTETLSDHFCLNLKPVEVTF